MPIKLQLLMLLTVLFGADVQAADWGVGFSAGADPSLSLQHRYARSDATHYRAHYSEDVLVTGFDYQRFIPQQLPFLPHSVEFYAGFGLAGEARKEQGTKELFHARIPAGMQWNSSTLRMSAFIEGAARMGPIPKTTLTGVASGGIRTVF